MAKKKDIEFKSITGTTITDYTDYLDYGDFNIISSTPWISNEINTILIEKRRVADYINKEGIEVFIDRYGEKSFFPNGKLQHNVIIISTMCIISDVS